MESLDHVVIGAGIHGAAVADSLAGRAHQVRVYEKGPVAGGPTARSSAVCRAYYTAATVATGRTASSIFIRTKIDSTWSRSLRC